MASFDQAIPKILAKEGGEKYTEIEGDAGGATKFGISKRSYPHLDIAHLTEHQACEIYRQDYWSRVSGDAINSQPVAESIFDAAVNMGTKTASRLAQSALNEVVTDSVVADGAIGPGTLAALNKCSPNTFLLAFALAKVAYYAAICNRDRSQAKFLLGWVNRSLGGI